MQQTTRLIRCFICNDLHQAKEHLKREKLTALMSADDQAEYDEEAPSHVNSLQLLNVMHSEGPAKKMLMHVNVIMNGA